MCMIDDADCGWDFVSTDERKARKDHKCTECSRIIKRGEIYEYTAGRADGTFWHYHVCVHCIRARSLLQKECGGWLYQGVYEDLYEHINEALPWSMKAARLCVGMNRKWKRFRSEGLMTTPPYYTK